MPQPPHTPGLVGLVVPAPAGRRLLASGAEGRAVGWEWDPPTSLPSKGLPLQIRRGSVAPLSRGWREVLGEICHEEADEDQHDADGAPDGRHGDDDVPHAGRLHGELHAVGRLGSAAVGVGEEGLEAEAVTDAAVRVGQQVIPAGGAQPHAVALETRVGAFPRAGEGEAAQGRQAIIRPGPLQQDAAVAEDVG